MNRTAPQTVIAKPAARSPAKPDRRRFFNAAGKVAGLAALVATAGSLPGALRARAADTPIGPKWWPSSWGAGDQKGATNYMTPKKTLEATKLIRTGKVHKLGRVYESEMPLFGSRAFALRSPGSPTGGTFGDNKIVWNDEFLCTEIGQVGTQFDGLAHIGVEVGKPGDTNEQRFYNGFSQHDMAGSYGLAKLGIEHLNPFFTRGILVDVRDLKGRMLDKGEELSVADITGALKKQGMSASDITPGDAVLFRTGWGELWKKDNARFNSGAPGIGLDAGKWLASKKISMVGSDTWPVEVVPNPNSKLAFPVHQELIVRNGIFIHENLNFDSLAADGTHLFAYIFSPVPIRGATGSPGSPLGIA